MTSSRGRSRKPEKDARPKQLAIADRRAQTAALYLAHWNQYQIAERLGVDQSTVSRDIASLQLEWQVAAADDIAERKARESVELDAMEQQTTGIYDDYDRGIRDGTNEVIEGYLREVGDAQVVIKIGFSDDPRFGALDRRLKIKERRARLFGLDAPKVRELSGPGGSPISMDVKALEALDDEELRELLAAARRVNAEAAAAAP